MQLLNELVELAGKVTALNLDTAQSVKGEDGYIECPLCCGEGHVDAENDYCNIDAVPLGVQFYGIGPEHGLAEQYFRAANPAAILAIAEYVKGLENQIADAGKTMVPAGWKLVPANPTPKMMVAGTLVSEWAEDPSGMYRAMIVAAPEAYHD